MSAQRLRRLAAACVADGKRISRAKVVEYNVRFWPKADVSLTPPNVRFRGKADMPFALHMSANDPKRTFALFPYGHLGLKPATAHVCYLARPVYLACFSVSGSRNRYHRAIRFIVLTHLDEADRFDGSGRKKTGGARRTWRFTECQRAQRRLGGRRRRGGHSAHIQNRPKHPQ